MQVGRLGWAGSFRPDHAEPRSAVCTCLSANTFLTADPGVKSYIPVRSQSFVGIDHVIIPMAIFPLSADSRVICARSTGLTTKSSLPRKKSVVRLTYHPDRTIAVDWDVKHQPKQTKSIRLRAYKGLITLMIITCIYWL